VATEDKLAKPVRKTDWLVSFLDMWMLLLAFFLILAARAEEDESFFSRNKATGMQSSSSGQAPVNTPIWELKRDLESELESEIGSRRLHIQSNPNELRLQFVDAQFFETASADISEEGVGLIGRLIGVLNDLSDYDFQIDVEGHTDDRPIETVRFRSNWELSAARAATIVRTLADRGFPSNRLKASGYAETQPLVQNPAQMALNRRIVVRIYYQLQEWP